MTTTAAAAPLSISSCSSSSSSCFSSPNRIRQRASITPRVSIPFTSIANTSINLFTQSSIRRRHTCDVALKFDASSSVDASSSAESSESEADEEDKLCQSKIGARVRVKGPQLKVYHVPKVPEMDIAGMEGEIKQYVAVWKGKRISANFPFKVEFFTEIEGRGRVKFFAHLREDEFEYITQQQQ